MISVEDLVSAIEVNDDKRAFKLGIITGLFGSGRGKIKFDGEDIASGKEYLSLNYTAVIGDRVLLAIVGGTYITLGKVR